nr:MAG TPA: hypothetical protein [Caudoviricetes sp.]
MVSSKPLDVSRGFDFMRFSRKKAQQRNRMQLLLSGSPHQCSAVFMQFANTPA